LSYPEGLKKDFFPKRIAAPPYSRQLGYLYRSVTFRPSLAAGLALSCFLYPLLELYVKRSFLVNGTTWHKATKSSKKENPGNFINSKLIPKTQLQMEHVAIKDVSRLCLQVNLVEMLGSLQNNTTLSTVLP
jgi:hypothetical protein